MKCQIAGRRSFGGRGAEAGLSAFSHAEAAVAYARRPIHEAGEGSSRKRAADELPAHSELRDRLYAPLERLRHHNDAFGDLERAAFNVEVHFGDQVARHLREPLRAYNRIAVVTSCRMSHAMLGAPGQVTPGMVRWWESVVYAAGTKCGDYNEGDCREVDQLSIDMARARRQSRQPSGLIWMRRPLASSCFRPNL